MTGEVRFHPWRKFLWMAVDVTVHASCKSLVHVARVPLQFRIDLNREKVVRPALEIGVERARALVACQFTPGTNHPDRHAVAIILELEISQRVAQSLKIVRVYVRDAVVGSNHLYLIGQGPGWGFGPKSGRRGGWPHCRAAAHEKEHQSCERT